MESHCHGYRGPVQQPGRGARGGYALSTWTTSVHTHTHTHTHTVMHAQTLPQCVPTSVPASSLVEGMNILIPVICLTCTYTLSWRREQVSEGDGHCSVDREWPQPPGTLKSDVVEAHATALNNCTCSADAGRVRERKNEMQV